MLTTKKDHITRAEDIGIIKASRRHYKDVVFDKELEHSTSRSLVFMVSKAENRINTAIYKAKKQNITKCN